MTIAATAMFISVCSQPVLALAFKTLAHKASKCVIATFSLRYHICP